MPPSNFSNLRKEERKSTMFQARFLVNDNVHDCGILDISPGGAKLKFGKTIASKTDIVLDLDKFGQFTALTAWCSNGTIGIKFTDDPSRTADAVMALAMFGSG